MKPILEVERLGKLFGANTVFRDIGFSVYPGEIISVLGPSGCGKSTLLQLIAGLQQPDAGEIRLRGQTVASASKLVPPEKRGINMVFQDYALWPHMNVYDNIAYGMRRQRKSAAAIAGRIGELTTLLRLGGLEHRLPPELSGGQQQRVAIARALATQPDLLLLDEPLSNLDMRLRIEMRAEMAYMFRELGTTVFHVTHDPDEAFAMADRLMIMRAGAVDQFDRPQVCYSRPATLSAAMLLGAGNRLKGRGINGGAEPSARIGDLALRGTAPEGVSPEPAAEAAMLFRPDAAVWRAASQAGSAEREIAAAVEHQPDRSSMAASTTAIGGAGSLEAPATLGTAEIVSVGVAGDAAELAAQPALSAEATAALALPASRSVPAAVGAANRPAAAVPAAGLAATESASRSVPAAVGTANRPAVAAPAAGPASAESASLPLPVAADQADQVLLPAAKKPQSGDSSGRAPEPAPAFAAANSLPVRIVHSVFEGKSWRILAMTEDGQKVSFLHEEQLEKDELGSLTITISDMFIYPDENER